MKKSYGVLLAAFFTVLLAGCSSADPEIEIVRSSFVDELGTTTVANVLEGRIPCRSFRWHRWEDGQGRSIIESRCVLDLPVDPLGERRSRSTRSVERSEQELASAEAAVQRAEAAVQRDQEALAEAARFEFRSGLFLERERQLLQAKQALLLAKEKYEGGAARQEAIALFLYPEVDSVVEVTQWIITGDRVVLPISVAIVGERTDNEDIYLGGSPWIFNPLSGNVQQRIEQTEFQVFRSGGMAQSWPRDSVESILNRHYRLN
ncbi:MAG: hypothetical protein ACXIUB_03500 [Wenzhouxiangella sp.]